MARVSHLSVTQLLTYLACPKKYWYERVEKPRRRVPTPWQFVFGKAAHEAIEVLHKGNSQQSFEPTTERPLFFKSAKSFAHFALGLWQRRVAEAEADTGILWLKKEGQKEALEGLLWAMLAGTTNGKWVGYYNAIQHPPFDIEILEVEYRISVDLFGHPFVGVVDQIWRKADGTTVLVDFTTGWLEAVKFLQTTAYDQALRAKCNENPGAKKRFGLGPYEHYIWNLRVQKLLPTAPQEVSTLREALEHVSTGILQDRWPETQQDYTCQHCPYRQPCEKTMGPAYSFAEEFPGPGETSMAFPIRSNKSRLKQRFFPGWIRSERVRTGTKTPLVKMPTAPR